MIDVLAEARAWLAEDPDAETRAELQALLEDGGHEALATLGDMFAGTLEFGTAGLRGALGPGPNRMNRIVVSRAAAGLAAYLKAHGGESVVVGYDARHNSQQFARDTAEVMSGAGMRAMVLPRTLPTPVLAFAIRHLGADAGVMVTASHNPPQDNGYKVYLGDGSQIVPPSDAEISAEIAAVGPVSSLPRGDTWTTLDESVLDAYLDRVAGLVAPGGARDVRMVYTPLHGVGRDVVLAALERAGFPAPTVVSAQGDPDPDFPTVAFPNPEEPGAMDLALAAGAEHDADVILANDPDADRCAMAVPTADGPRMLRGDEVGALLSTHLLRRYPDLSGTFAASIVSSSLLGRIAGAHGLGWAETLTGFKWIAKVEGLRYGYEEALGYCVDPDGVRDKDGVSALTMLAELAAGLKAEGRTVLDLLDDIALEYGVHATGQVSLRVTDLSAIGTMMAALRSAPPAEIGGRKVEEVEDLELGVSGLPPTDGLRYRVEGGGRVIVRPSGTEPKIKCYLEVVQPVVGTDLGGLGGARSRAAATLADLDAGMRELLVV